MMMLINFSLYMEQMTLWDMADKLLETEMTEKKEKIIESATFAAHANNR